MTPLRRGDRRTPVAERLEALDLAVQAGRDVLPEALVLQVQAVEQRAGDRLRLSNEHTVVALAGSTGSGKSSLVNALVGQDLAIVDVRRPTTSETLAVIRGEEDSGALLDWLEVRRRHVLDVPGAGEQAQPGGLVLLDLPDHDSVQTGHRLEAERLIALVDLMVWVVDPQKYADAALHERYLRSLTGHRDVLVVVLNQVDRLTADERAACHRDLVRLLAEDGLAGVQVVDVSATTGAGVDALRSVLDDAARRRQAVQDRLTADVVDVAQQVLALCGSATSPPPAVRQELVAALQRSAGVPAVVGAVRDSRVLRARLVTGWPPTRWLGRFRADPLRRLHLGPQSGSGSTGKGGRRATVDGVGGQRDDADLVRTSVPAPGPAERARARSAVRGYVDAATRGAPEAWVLAARRKAEGADGELTDALDQAVARTQVVADRRPAWWGAVGTLQWALLAVLVAGLGWLGVLAGLDSLRLVSPEPPQWRGIPVPTLAAIGGAVLGILLAAGSRLAARAGGRRAAERATARLHAAVSEVAERVLVSPVAEVLDRMDQCRGAATRAAEGGRSR